MTDRKVGLVGFVCPRDGQSRTFNHCVHSCTDRCRPLPLLLALMSRREPEPGIYHVTEILNPPRQVYLARNNAYYATPESLIWATFGSAWHGVVEEQKHRLAELGMAEEWLIEQPFEREIKTKEGTALLRGTSDAYEVSRKILHDFKTLKAYAVKKLKNDMDWNDTTYHFQTNIYRHYQYPEAKELHLDCLIKDWSEAIAERDGLAPFETVQTPLMSPEYVQGFTEATLGYHLLCQRDPGNIRDCSESERWTNNRRGVPMRCLKYCAVAGLCPQRAREIEEAGRVR